MIQLCHFERERERQHLIVKLLWARCHNCLTCLSDLQSFWSNSYSADSTSQLKVDQLLSGLLFCACWCEIRHKRITSQSEVSKGLFLEEGERNRALKNECEVQIFRGGGREAKPRLLHFHCWQQNISTQYLISKFYLKSKSK